MNPKCEQLELWPDMFPEPGIYDPNGDGDLPAGDWVWSTTDDVQGAYPWW